MSNSNWTSDIGKSGIRGNRTRQKITKKQKILVIYPNGQTRSVWAYPGDTVTTTKTLDGRTIRTIDHKDVSLNYSTKPGDSKYILSNNAKSTSSSSNKKLVKKSRGNSGNNYSGYLVPKNDLSFISEYILAYSAGDAEKLNVLKSALSKNPNKDIIYKYIWEKIDPLHTPERSAALHEILYTNKGMGAMNWNNIFGGNLLLATSDDASIPRSSLEYLTPEQRSKVIELTSEQPVVKEQSSDVENIIRLNADMFKTLYEYAKQHNEAFNYLPSAFDSLKLNSNYKYGGLGDFLTTYGISPRYLYSILSLIYE